MMCELDDCTKVMRLEENSFGDIVMRLLPGTISLAKLSREADVDYAYFHSLMKGHRGGKPLKPSMEMVIKVREAFERLQVEVPAHIELDLLETAVQLPEGFSIIKDNDQEAQDAKDAILNQDNVAPLLLQKLIAANDEYHIDLTEEQMDDLLSGLEEYAEFAVNRAIRKSEAKRK